MYQMLQGGGEVEVFLLMVIIVASILLIFAIRSIKHSRKEQVVNDDKARSINDGETNASISLNKTEMVDTIVMEEGGIMNKQSNTITFLSIIGFIASAICVFMGFNKMLLYKNNSESSYLSDYSVNAYVGGDAYNYIINGTYATAYFVLALVCMMFACTMLLLNKKN